METDDHPHPTVKTARLRSADSQHVFELVLKPLQERKHLGWHSYGLKMINTRTGETACLSSTKDRPLFMDKAVEPEIPALCAGLRMVVDTGNSYEFEPVDERDFRLAVAHEPQGISVKIQYDLGAALPNLGWPRGLIVEDMELVRFADELEAAYREL